ncbi:hypothetical protein AVEN_240778-1 [Araneus ventricosus]|uniref:Uncharacterized protein n=1 Tax=Araneus ventricosus TaxID=182803 RepID=A0A4Y2SPB6_ARAVE|nr:hypothetical protein AVEN_240778-1 [Araneus ventricosus]
MANESLHIGAVEKCHEKKYGQWVLHWSFSKSSVKKIWPGPTLGAVEKCRQKKYGQWSPTLELSENGKQEYMANGGPLSCRKNVAKQENMATWSLHWSCQKSQNKNMANGVLY